MIKIETLKEADIGKRVIYKSGSGDEEGILKSWNDVNIFVVYFGSNPDKERNYKNYTAAATKPEDLFWYWTSPTI